jgi:HEAT repeat protein
MFTLVAYAVIILTLAVIVLSAFVVLGRYFSDLTEARVHRLRKSMQRSLDAYLDGTADEQTVIRELGQDRNIALGVLVGSASRLSRDARKPLRNLFGHFEFPQQWIAGLRARRWAVRVHAASHLGYMCHEEAIPELVKALDDEMLDVRLAAAHALAQLGAAQAVQPILRALALPAAWPLQRCAEILHEMGPAAIEPLLGLLREHGAQDQPSSVQVAIRVLGMQRVTAAAPLVSRFLRSPDMDVRLASAKALGQMGDSEMIFELASVLTDSAWEVRSAAAQALGALHSAAAVTPLCKVLADPAWWVRFNAAESLFRLGAGGLTALKTAMAKHPDEFASDISRQVLEEHGAIPAQEALPT